MLFSYNWLNEYLKYTLSPQQISDLLTMHAFEVESVQEKGGDWLLDISVLPNRASDALCHQGMAREINAIAGFKEGFVPKEAKSQVSLDQAKQWFNELPRLEDFSVVVKNSDYCPLYYALKIKGVKVGQSPQWLKEKLTAVGQDSINNLVDISNFVMLDVEQPTHIFDARAIEEKILQVRPGSKGELLDLLGGARVKLTSEDLVIADAKKALAVAGIKGGQRSSVNEKTQDIIIEVANFNSAMIYRSAASLHIATESAKRFSAGIAYDLALIALYQAAYFIQEVAGGQIVGLAVYESKEVGQKRAPIIIDLQKINQVIGTPIKSETAHKALFNLGFGVSEETHGVHKVTPPYWRTDCTILEDIAEEVVRLYGLDNIPAKSPRVELGEVVYEDALLWRSFIRHFSISQGFDEMYNYSLRNSQQPTTNNQQLIKLLNPISEDKAFLRDNLTDGLLQNVQGNQGLFQNLKLFEVGNVFWQENGVVCEEEHIAGIIFNSKRVDFREMRGYVEGLLQAAGFDEDDYVLEPSSKGRSTAFLMLSLEGKECGSIFVPSLPSDIKIKGSVVAFEIRANIFYQAITDEREFAPPPRFPAVVRDISLLLPSNVKGDSVVQVIHEVGKDLIEDVDLFDVYQDGQARQKSLAFHIMYRSANKTLTDSEVNLLHKQIEQELTKRLHAQIR